MTTPEPSAPVPPPPAGALRPRWLLAALPHLLTALLAVAVSLAAQALLVRPASPAFLPPTPAAAAPATAAPTSPPGPPTAAAPPLAAGVARQELLDIRAEISQMWTAIYLARAISQAADAEAALRRNDLESVARSLVEVDDSLALAHERAADSSRNPIAQLRRDVGEMRGDLIPRPEGMDVRLARLRQLILTLIEARQ